MHSRITSRPTGRFRSRRLRTARVVVSNSSTEAMSIGSFALLVEGWSELDRARLADTEDGQRSPQAEKHRDAQREIEDLLIGERLPQPLEERVVHRRVVIGEALRVLDGQALARGVAGVAGVGGDG